MAQEMGHLKKVGSVSVDGSKFKANASKHAAVSYKRAEQMILLLQDEVAQLTAKAEAADSAPLKDGLLIPDEIKRRKERITALDKARKVIEERFEEKQEEELEKYEEKKARRDAMRENGKKPKGREPKPPSDDAKPDDKNQYNFTDPQSRIMKHGGSKHFGQSYNAQAAVDADGSMLILGGQVTDDCNDKKQLIPVLNDIDPLVKEVKTGLADTGYFSEKAILELEKDGTLEILCAMEKGKHGWSVEQLEEHEDPPAPPDEAPLPERMKYRLKTKKGKAKYKLRKETVEPVFGIIKAIMGFREFTMRGLEKVNIEWDLVKLSYNIKKLFKMMSQPPVPASAGNSVKNG